MDAVSTHVSAVPQMPGKTSRSGIEQRELQELVLETEAQLRSLGNASILITGATGWFGVWLIDFLSAADDMLNLDLRIAAVSRDPERFLAKFPAFSGDSRITWIKADVRELPATGDEYSHVIHAAADTTARPGSNAAAQLFDTIVDGTRRALAAAGPNCRSFLLLSSGAVYGPARAGSARFYEEDAETADVSLLRNEYAIGKREAERICAVAGGEGIPARIARCFAFVGPQMPFDRHFAIGNFIADAAQGQPIRVRSDGRPQRSYLYMTDLLRALLAILTEGSVGRPYNVGSEICFTIEQVARCVDRIVGGGGVMIEGVQSDPCDRYIPDTTRLRTELKCAQHIGLETAIAQTAAWYRAQIRTQMSP